jgi:hypothetical protein
MSKTKKQKSSKKAQKKKDILEHLKKCSKDKQLKNRAA